VDLGTPLAGPLDDATLQARAHGVSFLWNKKGAVMIRRIWKSAESGLSKHVSVIGERQMRGDLQNWQTSIRGFCRDLSAESSGASVDDQKRIQAASEDLDHLGVYGPLT
jgi:hypothetical protein